MLPSEHEKKRLDLEAKKKAAEKEELKIKQRMNRLFSSDDGIAFLKWLQDNVGYHESGLLINPTTMEINMDACVYNMARRSVFIMLRNRLKPEILKQLDN